MNPDRMSLMSCSVTCPVPLRGAFTELLSKAELPYINHQTYLESLACTSHTIINALCSLNKVKLYIYVDYGWQL